MHHTNLNIRSKYIRAAALGVSPFMAVLLVGCMDAPLVPGEAAAGVNGPTTASATIGKFQIVGRPAPESGAGAWEFSIEPAHDPQIASLNVVWTFGDGLHKQGLNQLHIFETAGQHSVNATGYDSDGEVEFDIYRTIKTSTSAADNPSASGDNESTASVDAGTCDPNGDGSDCHSDGEDESEDSDFADTEAGGTASGDADDPNEGGEEDADGAELPPMDELDDDETEADTDESDSAADPLDMAESGDLTRAQEPVGRGDAGLPVSTVVVSTEEQLQAAAARSRRESLNILIDGPITVNDTVRLGSASGGVVRLLGLGDRPTLNFNMTFDGVWTDRTTYNRNGLDFGGERAVVRNLTLTGYQLMGSAIKVNNPNARLLDVSNCEFRDIGTQWYAPKVDPPTIAADTIHTQCIGAHDLTEAHINVTDCEFLRCTTNQRRWSHCLYVSARCVSVKDNTFEECGNPFALGGAINDAANNVFGNLITRPALSIQPDGQPEPPYLAGLGGSDYSAYLYNTVSGEFQRPWLGTPNSTVQCIGENDYSAMTFSGYWAVHTGVGYLTWEQWQDLGFDGEAGGTVALSTVIVHDESELRAAAARTASENLNILIANSMIISETISFPAGDSLVRVLGMGDKPTLSFNMAFDGQWDGAADSYSRNGLEFLGARAVVRNLAFADYQLAGAAVAGQTSQSLDISDCDFHDIATQWHAPRVDPPATAEDTIHAQCISASSTGGHVSVSNCLFERCATNQRDWSHVLEIDAPLSSLIANTFDRCGTAFRFTGTESDSAYNVFGNRVTRPARSIQSDGVPAQPQLCKLDSIGNISFTYNIISGEFLTPWTGSINPDHQHIGENDYTEMTYVGTWAFDTDRLDGITWDDWQDMGFH